MQPATAEAAPERSVAASSVFGGSRSNREACSSHAWVGVRQRCMTTRTQAALAPAATGGPPSAIGCRRPDSEREGARSAPDELVPVASLEFGASERLGASDLRMRRSARFHIVITVAVGAGVAGVLLIGVGWIPRTQRPRQEKAAGSEVVTAALPIHATRPTVRSRGHRHPRRRHRVARRRSARPDTAAAGIGGAAGARVGTCGTARAGAHPA